MKASIHHGGPSRTQKVGKVQSGPTVLLMNHIFMYVGSNSLVAQQDLAVA